AAERALKVAPESKPAKLRKAELLVDMGVKDSSKDRLAQGRAIVDAVLASEPNSPEAHFVEAKLDLAEAKNEEAVAALRKVLEGSADSLPAHFQAQTHFLLASALMLQGERQDSRAEGLKAVQLGPGFVAARRPARHN